MVPERRNVKNELASRLTPAKDNVDNDYVSQYVSEFFGLKQGTHIKGFGPALYMGGHPPPLVSLREFRCHVHPCG